jgi:AraC family transcriptional regulator of adaptative response/methylated-DNA-[protein]-cysteine methyltransferase
LYSHYKKIAQAICFINENLKAQPSLEEIANAAGLSPFHFQRLFREWAGITPKRFLQYLTVKHAKRLLVESNIFDTADELGLSSPSRLYDHFITLEAVTPGQFKHQGQGMKIDYGFGQSPFGLVFIAATERGICHLSFSDSENGQASVAAIKRAWPNSEMLENPLRIEALSDKIFNPHTASNEKFHLFVQGSNFQIKVWESLLQIPHGVVCSYQQVADSIAAPTATRAVANAIAKNPIGFLIPCHRVIRNTGAIGGYRWNSTRKQAILAWESANTFNKSASEGDN